MKKNSQQAIELEEATCPLCGSAERRPLLKGRDNLYHLAGDFQIVRCRLCRHVYMNPRPTDAAIPLCYPAEYGPHRSRDEAKTDPVESAVPSGSPWYLSPWARRIPGLRRLYYWLTDSKSEYIPTVASSSKRALEIGCATGGFLVRLHNEGWNAKGVELAESPARQAAEQGFDVHVGTFESAAFAEASFDAVFAWMVIEHLQDPKSTLREIHRILEPGACFAFSVPNFASWERWFFGRCWHAMELPRHLQHFTQRTLRSMLDDTGFDAVTIRHQRNLLSCVGSMGIGLQRCFPRGTLGQRLIGFSEQPTLWWQLALAPLAILLALARQGGRLTVIAHRKS